MQISELISDDYKRVCEQAHASPRPWGADGWKHAGAIAQYAKSIGARSILDYGCGQCKLRDGLERGGDFFEMIEYDPAIPAKSALPDKADLVACTDVLEHIEPEKLDSVLQHIWWLARKGVFLVVNTRPANKILPDGRNAHLIVEPWDWWVPRVQAAFTGYQIERLVNIGKKEFTYVSEKLS